MRKWKRWAVPLALLCALFAARVALAAEEEREEVWEAGEEQEEGGTGSFLGEESREAEKEQEEGGAESSMGEESWDAEKEQEEVWEAGEDGANQEEEIEKTVGDYLEELDFAEIDAALGRQESTEGLDFRELVERLILGEEIDKGWLLQELLAMAFREVGAFRGTMAQIIFLCAVFAILHNFANVFENPPVTKISYYMAYLLLLVLLTRSFSILRDVSVEVISEMLTFLKVLIPTFTMSMTFSGQATTAAAFYDMTFFVIYGMEWIMRHFLVPAVQIYVVLELMDCLAEEELLSRMTELIRSGVLWLMKALFTLVVGINVVQSLLTPVIDTFKSNLLSKTVGLAPGIGISVNAMAGILIGSGIIIKNGIGLAALIVLAAMCAGPLIKVGVMAFLYRLVAAVMQPISDKRMVGCIISAGEGGRLLWKIVATTVAMFMVAIAMITAATTWR